MLSIPKPHPVMMKILLMDDIKVFKEIKIEAEKGILLFLYLHENELL